MAVATLCNFKLVIPDHVEVAADMQEKFAEVLTVNATRINDRRSYKVGTSGQFNDKIALPSAQAYAPMIDAAFVSRRGRKQAQIQFAHKKNLSQGFEQYNDGLNTAFETKDGIVAKRYVDMVQSKKQNVSRELGRKTLRFTGDRIRGLGVSPIAANLLVNEAGSQGLLRVGDEWLGGAPYMVGLPEAKSIIKQGIVQNITKLGMNIINSDFDADEIEGANDAMVIVMNALSDITLANEFTTAKAAADSYLTFETALGVFYLNCAIRLGT